MYSRFTRFVILGLTMTVLSVFGFTDPVSEASSDAVAVPAIQGGNPSSSYSFGSVSHVNLYNGKLNVTIPLVRIGGRGSAGYNMVLPVEQIWAIRVFEINGDPSYNPTASQGGKSVTVFLYSPGSLVFTYSAAHPRACYQSSTGLWIDMGPFLTQAV